MLLKPRLFLATFAFGLALLAVASASAATVTVTNTADSGAGSLRDALSSANTGDTIDFNLSSCPCTIVTTAPLSITKSLLISGPGASQLTISGNNGHRVITISTPMIAVTLSGLTIANGNSSGSGGGGGILVSTNDLFGAVTISNCVFTNNASPAGSGTNGFGGGVFLAGGVLTIVNTTISSNTSNVGAGVATVPSGGSGETLTLAGCTISNNTAAAGAGGVYVGSTGSLTSSNTIFTNNSGGAPGGSAGAGISNTGSATIHGGSIDTNHFATFGDGAGISNTGTLELIGVSVMNNNAGSSGDGGAIKSSGPLAISQCNISNNQSGGSGAISSSSSLTISDSTIAGNMALGTIQPKAGAGGILQSAGTATISGCTISGNKTNGTGGGIVMKGSMTLTNSTISGNQVSVLAGNALGGGIYCGNGGTSNLSNCTIAFNSATTMGGGVVETDSGTTVNVDNTIIALNTSSTGPDLFGSFVSDGFNLIGATSNSFAQGFTNGTKGDIVGNLGAGAINPLLNPLADNGGLTQTHALQTNSPAIDKGNSRFGVVADQRGFPRFNDIASVANALGGNASDIGAFEFGDSTLRITSITRPSNGHIILRGIGLPNASHSVQAAPTPNGPSFVTIDPVLSDPSGNLQYDDATAFNLTDRFYRFTFP